MMAAANSTAVLRSVATFNTVGPSEIAFERGRVVGLSETAFERGRVVGGGGAGGAGGGLGADAERLLRLLELPFAFPLAPFPGEAAGRGAELARARRGLPMAGEAVGEEADTGLFAACSSASKVLIRWATIPLGMSICFSRSRTRRAFVLVGGSGLAVPWIRFSKNCLCRATWP